MGGSCSAYGGERNVACRVLARKYKGKIPLRINRLRWKNNIRMNLWRTVVSAMMNFQVP